MKPLLVVFLMALIVGSFTIVTIMPLGTAQQFTMPTPSVPEFSLKYVDNSHDVPTTTTSTTDPYTNKTTIITNPGYHVEEFNIEVTIKNQPFPSTIDGNTSNLYYIVQSKGHYQNWTEFNTRIEVPTNLPAQSSSEYTVLKFPANYPSEAEVDFRVKAILGYTYTYPNPDRIIPPFVSDFIYRSSDWSSTQTITIPNASPSPSTSINIILTPLTTATISSQPSTQPSIQVANYEIIAALIATIVTMAATIAVLAIKLKTKRNKHD